LGGLVGAREGLFRPLGVQSPTLRLRLNSVLNQVTRRGSFFGNSAGVVALIYNIADASIDAARGKHDMGGSIAAGGISGALFKCTGEFMYTVCDINAVLTALLFCFRTFSWCQADDDL
jgi:import inner membrane translocase subunit TIM23